MRGTIVSILMVSAVALAFPINSRAAPVRAIGGVANVLGYGAVGDCTTDDTAAIQAAIDSGDEAIAPEPPGGCYKTTATLRIGAGQRLRGVGVRPLFKAAFAGPVFTMAEKGWLENVKTDADDANRGRYTGVLVDGGPRPGAATQGVIRDVFVFFPGTGIWLRGGVYWWEVSGVTVYKFRKFGILLDNRNWTGMSAPNNNVFFLKNVSGDVPDDGRGGELWTSITWEQAAIKVDHGAVNTFVGGENAPALYGVIVTGGAVNNWFRGIYGEHQKYALKADAGTLTYWDSHSWTQSSAQIDRDAKVIGPGGLAVSAYNNWFQSTIQTGAALKALYFFNEGSGDVVIDHSGNGRHLKHNPGKPPTWTSDGRWGAGLYFDAQSGNFLDEAPLVSAIDWTRPFTLVMLVRHQGTWGGDVAFCLRDANRSRFTRVIRDGTSAYAAIQDGDGAGVETRAATTMNPSQTTDSWSWLVISFDPANHIATFVDPFGGQNTATGSGIQAKRINIRYSPLVANGGAGVSSVGIMRHPGFAQGMKGTVSFLGLWQRKLAWGEVLDLVNMKVPNLYPERGERTVKALAFARDGATTEARFTYGTAAPTTCNRGDIVWNAMPSPGGSPGWMCVAKNAPKAMPNLAQ